MNQFSIHDMEDQKALLRYEWDFVDSPPNDYICGHCNQVFRQPMMVECCGSHFCASCIEQDYGNLYRCPDCQEQDISAILSKKKWRNILELDVKCPFANYGCLWTGELGARAAHLDPTTGDCECVKGECVFGCGENLEKSEVAEHLELFCPKRPVTCPHCNEEGEHQVIHGNHKSECPEQPVDCPNSCGIGEIRQMSLQEHLSECPLEVVTCTFSFAGCQKKLCKKDLDEHLQDSLQEHLCFMAESFIKVFQETESQVNTLTEENDKQLQQLIELHSQELEEKDKIIQGLIRDREEEIQKRLKEKEADFEQKLEKIAEEFEAKYSELKQNLNRIDHLPEEIVDDREQMTMISLLHRGKSDKEIWYGKYYGKEVAIKHPLWGASPAEILKEAHILKSLQHNNIVMVHAMMTTGDPVCMILEYMAQGNLEHYLLNNRTLLLHQQILVCKQIAQGLDYLQAKLCIHRRIRVDNVLVGENLECKINDFSSAIFIQNYEEECIVAKGYRLRIKWCAPEVLQQKRFCLKSDVWAYGILLWQVVTSGEEPYPELTVDQAEKHICAGTHMTRPSGCSENFYTIMLDCWKLDPWSRPLFEALCDLLDHVKDSHKYTIPI